MSTHQHQLKAHCINRKQRTAAAVYIDKLEVLIREMHDSDTIAGTLSALEEAKNLVWANHKRAT